MWTEICSPQMTNEYYRNQKYLYSPHWIILLLTVEFFSVKFLAEIIYRDYLHCIKVLLRRLLSSKQLSNISLFIIIIAVVVQKETFSSKCIRGWPSRPATINVDKQKWFQSEDFFFAECPNNSGHEWEHDEDAGCRDVLGQGRIITVVL